MRFINNINNFSKTSVFALIFLLSIWMSSAYAIDDMEEDDHIDLLQIPLIDTNGDTKRLADYKGHFILLNFMYTTCHDVCPLQTASLVRLQSKLDASLRPEVQFVSITLDPEKDTAEELMSHAEKYNIDKSSWSFLTGSLENIRYITTRFSAISLAADAKLNAHNPRVFLLDKDGNLLLSYRSDPLNVERVESDLIDLVPL